MSESSLIENALIAKLLADATLMALVPDGVFYDVAGKSIATGGNATRFVIVSILNSDDEPQFGGRAFEDLAVMVKAVMLSTKNGDPQAAAARIDVLLEDQPLAAAGYTYMAMYRESRIRTTEPNDADPSIWWHHSGGVYRVQMAPV